MTTQEIKRIRRRLRLSQTAMAYRLGVALRTYQRWEHGETKLRKGMIVALRSMANGK